MRNTIHSVSSKKRLNIIKTKPYIYQSTLSKELSSKLKDSEQINRLSQNLEQAQAILNPSKFDL
jgi:hypothetical protein